MVIEKFRAGKVRDVYLRFDEKGRMAPDGVAYVNSWINEDVTICYQVMESESRDKLMEWISHWADLVDFEVVPVMTSAEARKKVMQ